MKHSWKLCIIFGGIFAAVALFSLLVLNGVMASADEKKREFSTSENTEDSGVSASAIQRYALQQGADKTKEENGAGDRKEEEDKKETEGKKVSSDSLTVEASIAYEHPKLPLGKQVAIFAAFWKGVPYMKGGAELPKVDSIGYVVDGMEPDPEIDRADGRGVDSPGFVQAVYKYYDIKLPRTCKEQEKEGCSVPIKDAVAGDLIFYGVNEEEATHCGICLGDGRVVHASSKAGKVIISNMNYRKIVSVRRVIK